MRKNIKFIVYILLFIIVFYLYLVLGIISFGAILLFPVLWVLLGFLNAFLISLTGLIIFIGEFILLFLLIEKKK